MPPEEVQGVLDRAFSNFARDIDTAKTHLSRLAEGSVIVGAVRGMRPEDQTALATSFVPGVGDAAGLYADYTDIRENWDQVPWYSKAAMVGAAALGAVPFVPSRSQVKPFTDALSSGLQRAYHGTADVIDTFDAAKRGATTKARSAKQAFWLTDDPEVAGGYARLAAEDAPVQKLIDESMAAERAGNWDEANRLTVKAEELEGTLTDAGGANIVPVDIDSGSLYRVDADGSSMSDLNEDQLVTWISEAKKSGAKGLQIDNFVDNADWGSGRAATHFAVFAPEDIRPAFREKIKAYHGSPHNFDKFTTEAIGTGEGAQAYGHGLYFAEAEDVATGYRDALTTPTYRDGTPLRGREKYAYQRYQNEGMNIDDLVDEMEHRATSRVSPDHVRKGAAEELPYLKKWQTEGVPDVDEGRMYEVEIDASPDEFLDWDLPLSEQMASNPKINEVVKDLESQGRNVDVQTWRGETLLDRVHGSVGRNKEGSEAIASQLLRDKGIKGIRYKDGFSRGADGGTSNYVVFDENLISIARKYGIAIPAAAAMLARQTGQNPQDLYEEDST